MTKNYLGRFLNFGFYAALALVFISAGTAHAATVVWDGSTDTDWSGTGDTTSWSGSTYNDGDDAEFNGAGAGTVNITADVNPGSISVNDGGTNYLFEAGGGVIGGEGSLTKNGAGMLTINTTSTYSGGTTLNGGILTVGNGSALGTNILALAGGTLRTDATGASLSIPVNVSGTNAVFAGAAGIGLTGAITGAGTLNVGGSGSGQVANSRINIGANSLNGFTGTLNLDNTENYIDLRGANTAAKLVTEGATSGQHIRLWGNAAFGELSGTGGLILGDNRYLTINQDTDTSYGGVLADLNTNRELGFTKGGSGRLTITSQCSYEFATTINGGTLEVSGRINETGSITIAEGAAFEVTGSGSLGAGGVYSGGGSGAGNIANNGTLTFNSTTDQELTGDISGTGPLEKDNTGSLALSGDNTYEGDTTVSGGTLRYIPISAMSAASTVSVLDGATLGVNLGGSNEWTTVTSGSGTLGGLLAGTGGQGNTVNYDGNVALELNTANAESDQAYAAVIADVATSLGITKGGAGTFSLIADNTYTGATMVNGGTLQLGNGGAGGSLNTASTITITGGTFAINQSDTVTQGTEFSGTGISGAGGFRQAGTGTTILNVANDYAGGTSINAGTLEIQDSSALGTGRVDLFGGGVLDFGADALDLSANVRVSNDDGNRIIRLDLDGTSSGTLSGQLDIRRTAAGEFDIDVGADDTLTVSNAIATNAGGGAGLTKEGDGTLIIQGNSSYSGNTTVNGGTLRIAGAGGEWSPGLFFINNASTLELATGLTLRPDDAMEFGSGGGGSIVLTADQIGRNIVFNSLGGSQNTISGGRINNQSGIRYIDYNVADGTDDIDLLVSLRNFSTRIIKDGAGTLSLVAPNNNIGNIDITGGTLEIGGAGIIHANPHLGDITNNSGIFRYNSTADQTLGGVISGTGDLEKDNTSTLTLSGANTYTGATIVSGGTLSLAGSLSEFTTVTIAEGAFMNLDTGVSQVVIGLTIDGVSRTEPGTYGRTGHPTADFEEASLTGEGVLVIKGSSGAGFFFTIR